MSRSSGFTLPSTATWANIATFTVLVIGAVSLLGLHDDAWWIATPRPRHWWLAAASLLAYAGFCGWIGWTTRVREVAASMPANGDATTLVVHASQTGFAQEIAERTAALLTDANMPVSTLPLGRLQADALARTHRALFVISTTGEGDPPDPAIPFVSGPMATAPNLSGLEYGLLALGDREYAHYCAFGHQLDHWLRAHGATPLFDLTEVDNGDPGALRHWQHHVALLCNATAQPDWSPPRYAQWTLRKRRHLNPGSAGAPAHHLELLPPPEGSASWQAGDILEIGPCNASAAVENALAMLGLPGDAAIDLDGKSMPLHTALARGSLERIEALHGLSAQGISERLPRLPHREYSIASSPDEGSAWLLVREMSKPDGTSGIGSGWLCLHAQEGSPIEARVRRNPNFHAPDPALPLLLIGNGTGIAGLRAHLVERIAAGSRRNWLLFGERSEHHDAFYRDELRQWQSDGWIERLELVFSRDGGSHRYVQDALLASRDRLKAWEAAGGTILVCGSLHGMAPAIDAVLRDTLGNDVVDTMLAEGRYRRDVY